MASAGDITRLIEQWQHGNRTAEDALFEVMYHRLHNIAMQCLSRERPGQMISATALVHEAYLRFRNAERLEIADRSHFLALAARVMHRILVDRARARKTGKRGNDPVPEELSGAVSCAGSVPETRRWEILCSGCFRSSRGWAISSSRSRSAFSVQNPHAFGNRSSHHERSVSEG